MKGEETNGFRAGQGDCIYLSFCSGVWVYPNSREVNLHDGQQRGSLTFLRAALCLPVLLLLVKAKGISLQLERREVGPVILLGSVGCALTTILLYLSYNYKPVGLSTTLHFISPAVIAVGSVSYTHLI